MNPTMEKLEKGDKVRVYGYSSRADDFEGEEGVIRDFGTDFCGKRFVVVTLNSGINVCYKESQLKKTKK